MRVWFGNVSGGRKKSLIIFHLESISPTQKVTATDTSCISYGKLPLTPPFQV